jgi:hypothetical protein
MNALRLGKHKELRATLAAGHFAQLLYGVPGLIGWVTQH